MVGLLDDNDDACAAAGIALASIPESMSEPTPRNAYSMMYGCSALAYDVLYDRLTDAQRHAYATWVIEGCVKPGLEEVRPKFLHHAGGNMGICHTLPGLLGLLCITGDPGVPDVSEHVRDLVEMLKGALHGFLGADGYPHEDIGYGTAVAGGLSHVVEAVRRAGLYDAYADCDRYTRIGHALLPFVLPGGTYLTNTGDHTDCFLCRELILARLAEHTQSPELLWLLGTLKYPSTEPDVPRPATSPFVEVDLEQPGVHVPSSTMSLLILDQLDRAKHPRDVDAPLRFVARDRGLVSLRDSWDDDALFVTFDGSQRSPAAQGHHHASCGHFSISALGEYFAIWPSRYNMEQSCHNVTLVNGRSGRSTNGDWKYMQEHGLLTAYEPGDFVDFASVDSSHQHNCIWARRSLGCVRSADGAPAYVWTVDDINHENTWSEFWWQLHTSPENTIAIEGRRATVTGWKHGHHLDVHVIQPAGEHYPKDHTLALDQDIAIPSSTAYLKGDLTDREKALARPAEMVHGPVFRRPRLLAKVGGYNGRFIAVMLPRRAGEAPAHVEQVFGLQNVLAFRVRFADVEDTLVWAYDHSLLEAGDIEGRGNWCIVRRDAKSGSVLRTAGCGVTRLTVAGVEQAVSPAS